MAVALAHIPSDQSSTQPQRQQGQRVPLPALTGLRFVAALLVVVHHFCRLPASVPLVGNVINSGLVGVNLFFILSGFILAYTYLTPDGQLRGSRRAFWIARVARVYPVYLLGVVIGCGPFLWDRDAPTQHLLRLALLPVLTLTQSWIPALTATWNPPGWSLSDEAFFYALFPLLGVQFGRLARRQVLVALGLLWLLTLIGPTLYLACVPPQAQTSGAYWEQIVSFVPLLRLPEFLMGVALGRLFVLTPFMPRACRWRGLVAVTVGAIALALVFSAYLPYDLFHLSLVDPLFAALIYLLAYQRGHIVQLLSTPIARTLGEASYALYIIHWPVWAWLTHLTGTPAAAAAHPLSFFLAYLALTVVLSLLVWRLLEQPLRRRIRSWARA